MTKKLLILIFILFAPLTLFAQMGDANRSYTRYSTIYRDGEKILNMHLSNIYVFANNKRGRELQKKYARLILAVRVTYPIAQDAKNRLHTMEAKLAELDSKKAQKAYVKGVEEELKEQYTPILKRMSIYQGVVLLKLIDRQTGDTSYNLVKELRGSISAFFWQGVARLFGSNLKTEYNSSEDDKILEEIVVMYEKGLL
ncbi:MAG: DUF4294 domain-containing protein [Rikenellaceae bacterium]